MPHGFLIAFAAGFLLAWFIMRTPRPAQPSTPLPESKPANRDLEVEQLLRAGRRTEAIARYRELYACDIATAVRMVETLEQILPR